MKKDISIATTYDESRDIEALLKKAMAVITDPDHSFTYHFDKCSFLSNTAIAILGSVANLVRNRYEKKVRDFLTSQDIYTHLSWAILNAIKHDENTKKALSQQIQQQIAAMPEMSPDAIRFQVISARINEMLLLKGEYQSLLSHYIHEQVDDIGVLFNVSSMSNQLRNRLITYNFLSYFSQDFKSPYAEGKYLGFRVHKNGREPDTEKIIAHLKTEWLTDERVKLSPSLKEDVVSRIFELFQNAFGHGVRNATTPIDVISCGDYDERAQTISLCIVDLGGGICKNVMRYLADTSPISTVFDNRSALAWALKCGNTTRTDSIVKDMPRGVGLELLKKFVHLNQGKLEIYTNDCVAFLNEKGEYEIRSLDFDFAGTVAKITINCKQDVIYSYDGKTEVNYF